MALVAKRLLLPHTYVENAAELLQGIGRLQRHKRALAFCAATAIRGLHMVVRRIHAYVEVFLRQGQTCYVGSLFRAGMLRPVAKDVQPIGRELRHDYRVGYFSHVNMVCRKVELCQLPISYGVAYVIPLKHLLEDQHTCNAAKHTGIILPLGAIEVEQVGVHHHSAHAYLLCEIARYAKPVVGALPGGRFLHVAILPYVEEEKRVDLVVRVIGIEEVVVKSGERVYPPENPVPMRKFSAFAALAKPRALMPTLRNDGA